MPRVLSAGLWRGVTLESIPSTRFRDVYLTTTHVDAAERRASLSARWDLETSEWAIDKWSVRLSVLTCNEGRLVCQEKFPVLSSHGEARCDLEDIDLWWPRGYGDAILYKVSLELVDDVGNARAQWRSISAFARSDWIKRRLPTQPGTESSLLWSTARKIFVKGTNWVPLDALHSRDASRLDETIGMLVDLNCNMIRCWGGNVYESNAFFRHCDEAGIMVWQDFAFACALYPQTPEFHAKVRAEAEAVIPLLRNHPSLALWAGNNEIDEFYLSRKPQADPNVDDQISREVLASACRRLDPIREYLPSSPYISPELWAQGAPQAARPEDHLWGPRDDFKGPYYVSSNAHFVSEIGYHGCPSRSSLEKMMTPEFLWPWQDNDQWLTHAVRPQPHGTAYNYRIQLMAHQTSVLFGTVPKELDDFIFAVPVFAGGSSEVFY